MFNNCVRDRILLYKVVDVVVLSVVW